MKTISIKTLATGIVASVLLFASCKKDRTCICTYTKSGSSSTDTEVITFNNVTKKTANANCTSGTTYDHADPSDFRIRNCTLSK